MEERLLEDINNVNVKTDNVSNSVTAIENAITDGLTLYEGDVE